MRSRSRRFGPLAECNGAKSKAQAYRAELILGRCAKNVRASSTHESAFGLCL